MQQGAVKSKAAAVVQVSYLDKPFGALRAYAVRQHSRVFVTRLEPEHQINANEAAPGSGKSVVTEKASRAQQR